ncbi:MAG: HK97 family phage prohead protease [Albidovulum sp.]
MTSLNDLPSHELPRRSSPPERKGVRRFVSTSPEMKRAGAALSAIGLDGAFEGYASLFGIADQGGDVVVAGAFRDSLARRGAGGVKMLWQHDPALPIGVWTAISEDARGLKVTGQLDLAVGKARELHALMRSGAVDGLSIGFRTERSRRDARTGQRRLEKIDLWEISLVTFPMLPQARVSAVKSIKPRFRLLAGAEDIRLIRAMHRATRALK